MAVQLPSDHLSILGTERIYLGNWNESERSGSWYRCNRSFRWVMLCDKERMQRGVAPE